jgi:hypothetical protein
MGVAITASMRADTAGGDSVQGHANGEVRLVCSRAASETREFGGHDTKQCNSRMKAGSVASPAPQANQAPPEAALRASFRRGKGRTVNAWSPCGRGST